MSVYNDMAFDAGYKYGTSENRQLTQTIEQDHYREMCEREDLENEMIIASQREYEEE